MTTRILMPHVPAQAGPPNEIRWLVGEGDHVASGSAVADVVCPHGRFAIWAADAGRIVRLLAAGRGSYPPGTELAEMDLDADMNDDMGGTLVPVPSGALQPSEALPARASPRARRAAAEAGLTLAALSGSGPGGRVIARDVDRPGARAAARLGAPQTRDGSPVTRATMDEPPRLQLAHAAPPAVALRLATRCQVGRLLSLRQDLLARHRPVSPDTPLPSFTDLVVKAWALALAEVPAANVVSRAGRAVGVGGVTLALMQAGQGAHTRVIPAADTASLIDLAVARRRGALEVDQHTGAAATSLVFVIDRPDVDTVELGVPSGFATALGVGSVTETVSVAEGEFEVAPAVRVVLSIDVGLVEPAHGLNALARLRAHIEDPYHLDIW
ncbi:MAG: E3 binding domain-containing protein [Hyphomicrobiaceae bacterium]|nr:E3 binding domain-containing protein [Hyphomicrobiaceae bacterium]